MADEANSRPKATGKVLLVSATGRPYNKGGYTIPPAVDGDRTRHAPLVLDLAKVDPVALEVIEGDPNVIILRTDRPFTPERDVIRY